MLKVSVIGVSTLELDDLHLFQQDEIGAEVASS